MSNDFLEFCENIQWYNSALYTSIALWFSEVLQLSARTNLYCFVGLCWSWSSSLRSPWHQHHHHHEHHNFHQSHGRTRSRIIPILTLYVVMISYYQICHMCVNQQYRPVQDGVWQRRHAMFLGMNCQSNSMLLVAFWQSFDCYAFQKLFS